MSSSQSTDYTPQYYYDQQQYYTTYHNGYYPFIYNSNEIPRYFAPVNQQMMTSKEIRFSSSAESGSTGSSSKYNNNSKTFPSSVLKPNSSNRNDQCVWKCHKCSINGYLEIIFEHPSCPNCNHLYCQQCIYMKNHHHH
ncbi:hypothetical protein DASC09_028230 [Saccharomycopsis crataegensis]|uniref:Uncharacterized protein n=1 Tax=Saccharomycopsis crataegensis TaxID=43959 RepID=A0AAV5QL35_9ASCO|nr:hypothetical protein DASC09_028230 [Saccharomycopsis crataegensis]